jgi:hypothetical protein
MLAAVDICDPINRALVLYTSFGRSPFPRARLADVAAVYGDAAAAELKARIQQLYAELNQPVPDAPGKRSRKSMTERAVEQLANQHPELDEEGLRVLAWTYSFGLR